MSQSKHVTMCTLALTLTHIDNIFCLRGLFPAPPSLPGWKNIAIGRQQLNMKKMVILVSICTSSGCTSHLIITVLLINFIITLTELTMGYGGS